jgi:homoaconitase/3-isopropylmalate dehydratase large subunit
MDRHVIANMGAELGATTSVFPADDEVKRFLDFEGRVDDWRELKPDPGCDYDDHDEIDLEKLGPLIAKPSSPGNVVPVEEVAGEEIYQAYIGSSANPGWKDFAVAAEIVRGKRVPARVSFDVNPTSREILEMLIADGRLGALLAAGGRIHQTGCNGCVGMGQAPAIGRNSLRTTPRNFPGRSGTKEDSVFLCSPGDGGSLGTRRQDHRPSLVANAATTARLPRHNGAERISTGTAAVDRGGANGYTCQRAEHSFAAGFRATAGQSGASDPAQDGRQRVD